MYDHNKSTQTMDTHFIVFVKSFPDSNFIILLHPQQ